VLYVRRQRSIGLRVLQREEVVLVQALIPEAAVAAFERGSSGPACPAG
jgi:hypothetical protein